jgi:2-methylisocitrate lyase-like PEP mutase family enzyme
VQEFERAGVAAIHVEDQVFPKRCGHLENKELVSREDYVAKIRAAAAAKRTPDFTIIARTDSRAVVGFDEAIIRANLAMANGADAVFVEAPQTMEEVEKVPKLVKGPCLLNMVRGGKTPEVPLADAERMGYAISILPGLLLGNIIAICDQTLAEVKRLGKFPPPLVESSPAKTFARFGAADWDARRTAFRDELKAAAE